MNESLYSNSYLGIKARSINIDDVEEKFSSEGLAAIDEYKNNSGMHLGESKTYASPNNYYPILFEKTNKLGITGLSEQIYKTKEELLITEYEPVPGSNGKPINTHSVANRDLKITQTYYEFKTVPSTYVENQLVYEMLFGTGENYWLASRYEHCGGSSASFGLKVIKGNLLGGNMMFKSSQEFANYYYNLRPIVTIPSNIKIETNSEPNSVNNMWKLPKPACTYVDEDNSGTLNLSDTVTCGTESFHVMSNDGSNVTMLAAKGLNLDVTNPIQSDSSKGIEFSTTNYWHDGTNYIVDANYASNGRSKPYVYGDYPDAEGNQQNNIYP